MAQPGTAQPWKNKLQERLFPQGYPGSNPGCGVIKQDLVVHKNSGFSLYPGSNPGAGALMKFIISQLQRTTAL